MQAERLGFDMAVGFCQHRDRWMQQAVTTGALFNHVGAIGACLCQLSLCDLNVLLLYRLQEVPLSWFQTGSYAAHGGPGALHGTFNCSLLLPAC